MQLQSLGKRHLNGCGKNNTKREWSIFLSLCYLSHHRLVTFKNSLQCSLITSNTEQLTHAFGQMFLRMENSNGRRTMKKHGKHLPKFTSFSTLFCYSVTFPRDLLRMFLFQVFSLDSLSNFLMTLGKYWWKLLSLITFGVFRVFDKFFCKVQDFNRDKAVWIYNFNEMGMRFRKLYKILSLCSLSVLFYLKSWPFL